MIAQIPVLVQDASWWLASVSGGILVVRRGVIALKAWMTTELGGKLDDIQSRLAEVEHLTKYHLGPNGDSPKLHERIGALERNSQRRREDHPQNRSTP